MADKLDDSAPFQDRQGTRIAGEPTGAGAGSPAGRPGGGRDQEERTSLTERQGEGGGQSEDRDGSEPLPDSKQHRSNYGGGSRK
jgi:hypothetical protein